MRKVLITGAAGFLGSHLVDSFLNIGFNVIGIDNLSTGSVENLQHLKQSSEFQFIEMDVTDELDFDVDLILNFACPASPLHYQKTPIQTLKTSIIGTLNCLDLAKNTGAKFLQASTSEVYGDPTISPQNEYYLGNVNPIGPRSCYDEGKRAAETAIFDYIRIHNIDARVVRIFNTYGPRMAIDDGRVVSNFIVSALKNNNISIYGDGNQSRSFAFVSDTISAITTLAQITDRPPTPINIGNPHEITMKELASIILRITNSKSQLEFFPLPIDDPKQRCPDITLANELLGWNPVIETEIGLKMTCDYFRLKLN